MKSNSRHKTDPFEAIFELNLGDFLTEHLISKEFSKKIGSKISDKTVNLKNQIKELISIYSIDKTLTLLGFHNSEEFIIYNSIAITLAQMFNISACHIYLASDLIKSSSKTPKFDLFLAGTSLAQIDISDYKNIGYKLDDESPVVKAYKENKTIHLKNAKITKKWIPDLKLDEDKAKIVICVPILNNWEKIGIIVYENYSKKLIPSEYIKLMQIIAELFVTSIRLQKLVEQAQDTIDDNNTTASELRHLRTELTAQIGDLGDMQQKFVEALAVAVDAKSKYPPEHSRKVAELAKKISENLNLNEKTTDLIYFASLLRNIGKIALSEEIFANKNKLSKEDWQKLQNHPNVGVSLLMKINFMSEIIPYINYHKERWDGKGEPEGLAGISIPLGARIVAVADAFNALTSNRPYRESLTEKEALEIVDTESGTKWDPTVVDSLKSII
jgi:HD-GYP domain-containing protein (c-di-GMP phosphodiesterase class II)